MALGEHQGRHAKHPKDGRDRIWIAPVGANGAWPGPGRFESASPAARQPPVRTDRGDRGAHRVTRHRRIIRYELPGGWTLLVGGSDADNEQLSLEIASPDDWWFHADAVPGSHAVLRAKDDENPTRDTLRHAAAVAAYHSKARHGTRVRVYCTRARYVRKQPGTKVGTVQVSQGTVMNVRPETSFATRVR